MFWATPHMFWYGSGFGFLPFIFNILFVFCIIALIFSFFRSHEETDEREEIEDTDTVLEILKKRYAKGEITKKEFDQMKKDIGIK